jgi:hypothetical protein
LHALFVVAVAVTAAVVLAGRVWMFNSVVVTTDVVADVVTVVASVITTSR